VSQCIISISTARRPRSSPNFAAGLLEASSARPQHDPPHRAAGDTVDAGQQLHPAGSAAAAVVAGTGEQDADRHIALALRRVHFVHKSVLAAPVAGDLEEPRRKGSQRLVQRLGHRGQGLMADFAAAADAGLLVVGVGDSPGAIWIDAFSAAFASAAAFRRLVAAVMTAGPSIVTGFFRLGGRL
jgi:hypothetical protein